ncbi:MAG: acyl-CoA dehydratase activase-related protein [Promethearchaeota archaeon]
MREKMLVSFPNMGHSWPAFKTLFDCMDLPVVLPDPTNRQAVKVGVKYSPEFVCFPFKTTLGDFVNAIEKGADTLVMAIDCGPCRFGFYHAVQERILHDMGYEHVRVIPLDQADLLEFKWVKMLFDLKGVSLLNPKSLFLYSKAVKAVQFFLKKAKYIEDIQTAEGIYRAYERNQGDTTRVVKDLLVKLDQIQKINELRRFKSTIQRDFAAIDVDKYRDPLKVTLAGEIHVTLEHYVNMDIRRRIGELGVEVHQHLSLYDWVVHKFHLNYHRKWLEHLARPYVPMDIGGECVWVVGEYIDRAKEGFDGFIHSYPFTCMPEVTARTIITNKLQPTYDLPAIFFSLDEQSGTEGFRTRIEAFVDLMNSRRDQARRKNGSRKIASKVGPASHYGHGGRFLDEIVQQIESA